MRRIGAAVLAAAALFSGGQLLTAQELLDASEQELIAREKVRSTVENVLETFLAARGAERLDAATEGIQALEPFGDATLPYLISELERESPDTYEFVAYTLGFMGTPGAAQALRDAIAQADSVDGAAALLRKAFACWALGLHGEIDALERVNAGNHRAGHYSIYAQTTVIEAISLLTAPQSVPLLIERYDLWGASDNKELRGDRRWVLAALRRVADPAAIPKLTAILRTEEDPNYRARAATALRSMETPESIDALMTALSDEDPLVRLAASFALEWMMPPGDAAPLLDLLDTETDVKTRGTLYQLVASRIRPEQLPRFLGYWNQENRHDRRLFIKALAKIETDELSDVWDEAVRDPNNTVALSAIGPLARSRTPRDTKRLLAAFDESTRLVVDQVIADSAGRQRLKEFAPAITRRLVELSQRDPGRKSELHSAIDKLGDALVLLRHTAAISKVRRARTTVRDPLTMRSLDLTLELLELLRKNGKSVPKWTALAADPSPDRRRLAWSRLAELGGDDAVMTLLQAYDDAEKDDRPGLLKVIVDFDTPETRALIRRVMFEPDAGAARLVAAWVAREYGGPEMFDLLAEYAVEREGLDADVLVYAAIVGGRRALPLFRDYRLTRLRYLAPARGKEQEILDWIALQLENGRPIDRYDLPPERLSFR